MTIKFFIKAKPKSKKVKIEEVLNLNGKPNERHFVVAVSEPAVDGSANKAITKSLAKFLKIAPSTIKIIRGEKSKNKVFEVID